MRKRYAPKQTFHLLLRKAWQSVGRRVRVEVADSAGTHPESGAELSGYAMPERCVIRVDRRQPPQRVLNTVIHEVVHTVCPDLGEDAVEQIGDLSEKIIERLFRVEVRD